MKEGVRKGFIDFGERISSERMKRREKKTNKKNYFKH